MDRARHIEERAAEWLARRDSGTWSEIDQAELSAWLAASTAHMVEFLRLEAAWEEANRLKAMGTGVQPGKIPDLQQWRASPFFKHAPRAAASAHLTTTDVASTSPAPLRLQTRRLLPYSFAASLLLALFVLAWHQGWFDQGRYSTPVGGIATLPMVDGSKITLSSNSQVRIAMTPEQRRVQLDTGEAFFEVARDRSRPFVVDAGDRRIVAVGTKFSVRKDQDDVRVIVTEGTVRIEREATKDILMTAGTLARARTEAIIVQQKPAPELEEALSWRFGYVVFHETPLVEAVAEFNRYNRRRIIIEDPALASIPVSGNFRATNFDAFVRLLRDGFAIHAREHGDEVVLSIEPHAESR
ncbi:MAG TPA: FecR domain-containing protein [Steroidobacter sp.]|uniref:FecR family protein n=1 Tax=Steroidobacter sp. TaxID=1978227 RepID=UPI002ED88F81